MTLADSILVLSSNFMPSFSRLRWRIFDVSASKPIAAMRGRNSMTVTSAPSRAQTEPSSRPIAPAPMTSIVFGTFSSAMPWSLLMTRLPSNLRNGSSTGTLPVASRMFCVLSVFFAPPSPVTSTVLPSTSLPRPFTTSILFFFIR